VKRLKTRDTYMTTYTKSNTGNTKVLLAVW